MYTAVALVICPSRPSRFTLLVLSLIIKYYEKHICSQFSADSERKGMPIYDEAVNLSLWELTVRPGTAVSLRGFGLKIRNFTPRNTRYAKFAKG